MAAADVTRRDVRELCERDTEFGIDCEDALADFADEMDAFAISRAMGEIKAKDGSVRQTFNAGLLRFLLKGRKPEIYGSRSRAEVRSVREEFRIDDADPPQLDRGRQP